MSIAEDEGRLDFGQWVRSRRTVLLLTQEELATRAGVSVRTIQNLETGRGGAPRLETRRLILATLGEAANLPGNGLVPAQLPADVAGFTGRVAELSELDRLIETDVGTRQMSTALVISALSGTGGVGKTALAVRWAHRVRAKFPDGQLYVNLRGYDCDLPVAPGDVLARFLHALGVTGSEVPLDIDERAARYRTAMTGRRMLVVLDNASNVEQVRLLLPGAPSCVVVVTSRDPLAGLVAMHGAHRLDLDRLPLADAVALLRSLIGPSVDAEPEAAVLLAEQCARLPLALRVAADLAVTRRTPALADLVGELADQQRRLDLLDAGGDPRAAVRAVFSWSYDQLPDDAARAFRLIGQHPGPDLDAFAVAALTDVNFDHAQRLLETLISAHLIEPTASGRYAMHDLLRAFAAELCQARDTEADRQAALTRLCDYFLATAALAMDTAFPAESHRRPRIPPPTTPRPPLAGRDTALEWLDIERLTLTTCATTVSLPRHVINLAATLFRYHENGGHYSDLFTAHARALDAARHIGDQSAEAHAQTSLGVGNLRTGAFARGADHLERALAIFREIGDRSGEARALTNLGLSYMHLGRHESANDHLRQALTLHRDSGDRLGEARALTNLGINYQRLGRHEVAADHQLRALALFRDIGHRSGEAGALGNLGRIYSRLGRHEMAIEFHRQDLVACQEAGNRHGEAHALNNQGDVHCRSGRHELAADYHQQALALFEEIGDRHGQACALNGLGEAAYGTRRPRDAIAWHDAALTMAVETGYGIGQARAHKGLGHAHDALGNPTQARQHWDRALTLLPDSNSRDADDIRKHLATLNGAGGGHQSGMVTV